MFDAVITLGVTACGSRIDPLFTGKEFQETLLHTEFQGVPGHVKFDPETGTRVASDVQYSIESISLIHDNLPQPPAEYRFQANLVAVVQGDSITTHHPYVYHGNATSKPLALPRFQHDLHLVPLSAQILGYFMAGVLAISSLLCFFWTWWRRKTAEVLIASQPFFLCAVCVGTFVMPLSIVLGSFPGASPIHTTGSLSAGADTILLDFCLHVCILASQCGSGYFVWRTGI